jgi:hypothetical protein
MAHPRGAGAVFAGIAALLFCASLALPVATAQQTQGLTPIMGYELLFIGPFGVLNGQFGWIATPFLLVAIHAASARRQRLGGRTTAFVVLVMGLALLDAFFWRDYPNDAGPGPLVSHGPGYFLWFTAVVLGASGLIMTWYHDRLAESRR